MAVVSASTTYALTSSVLTPASYVRCSWPIGAFFVHGLVCLETCYLADTLQQTQHHRGAHHSWLVVVVVESRAKARAVLVLLVCRLSALLSH